MEKKKEFPFTVAAKAGGRTHRQGKKEIGGEASHLIKGRRKTRARCLFYL